MSPNPQHAGFSHLHYPLKCVAAVPAGAHFRGFLNM